MTLEKKKKGGGGAAVKSLMPHWCTCTPATWGPRQAGGWGGGYPFMETQTGLNIIKTAESFDAPC